MNRQNISNADWIDILLLITPMFIALFMVVDTIIGSILVGDFTLGHSYFGIDPAVGTMTIVVSGLTFPFVIIRGNIKF